MSRGAFGTFDFGLTEEEESRASGLHADSTIVDMLFQGPCGYRSFDDAMTRELEDAWSTDRDLVRGWNRVIDLPVRRALEGASSEFEMCWRESGITAGTRDRDLFSHEDIIRGFAIARAQFDRLPWLSNALEPADIHRAKEIGDAAGFISSQDTIGFGRDLSLIECAVDLGLRMLQLTYNSQNLVGCGCTERRDSGVSHFGVEVIRRLNELGVLIDTSHCGPKTTLDACSESAAPVIASHTTAAALYNVDRAKSDEELHAIAESGGVIGVCAVPFFLAPDPAPTIHAMLDHIAYIVDLVGFEHVGIGTDWPLQMPKWALAQIAQPWAKAFGFRDEHHIDCELNLIGFDDYRDFRNITRGLVQRGYSDESVKLILGENFLRVFGVVRDGRA